MDTQATSEREQLIQLIQYLELHARVPSFKHTFHRRLLEAINRGDSEQFQTVLRRAFWLLGCHVLEPYFKVFYGDPYLFRDFETGELTDVWYPVLEQHFLRRR